MEAFRMEVIQNVPVNQPMAVVMATGILVLFSGAGKKACTFPTSTGKSSPCSLLWTGSIKNPKNADAFLKFFYTPKTKCPIFLITLSL